MDGQVKVLIVDDDDLLRVTTRRVLESDGYKTFEAGSGRAGLQLLQQEKIELVLLDVGMPDMSGFEICLVIKMDPGLLGVGVIILSGGNIESDDKVTGINLGADDYITRPVPNRELLARVQAVLRVDRKSTRLNSSH